MNLQRTAMVMVIVFLTFYLLYIGQALLLPLVIAGAIAGVINTLSHGIRRIRVKGVGLPGPIAMFLAILMILASLAVVVDLVSVNINNVLEVAPEYEENFENLLRRGYGVFGVSDAPTLEELINQLDFKASLQHIGGAVHTLLSRTGIIVVYLIFILLEQRTFSLKLAGLVQDKTERLEVFRVVGRIRSDIRSYIGIKLLTSATTGILSYFVLRVVGVDFASFWAVLIFFLNFIPTIGSIIATTFPSILTLVQFDTIGPFLLVAFVLSSLQFCIGSLLEPRLMGNRLNLSPIVILLSLGLWGSIWGISGMFLCVPITVIVMIIFSYFPETRSVAILLSGKGTLNVEPRRSSQAGEGI